ncbi:MAG: transposase [Chitinophagales bacterium]
MSVKTSHGNDYNLWFVTFTCYQWKSLLALTDSYDLVYNWFIHLRQKNKAEIIAYVIMPNHVHVLIETIDKTDK